MKVILAKSAGFCYGVRRAVEMAEAAAGRGPVFLLGHITHNDHVIRHLEELGAVTVSGPEELPDEPLEEPAFALPEGVVIPVGTLLPKISQAYSG